MNWLDVAKGLGVGRSVRVKHDCNPNGAPSLIVRNEPDCYRAYCFRCKEPGMYEAKRLSLADRLEISRQQREADHDTDRFELPEPRIVDWWKWPAPAMQWLLKAGIGERDATELGIYYHPATRRVVVPYAGTHHWQARAVMEGAVPKYLADKNPRQCAVLSGPAWGGPVFLTEDLLSAYKIRMAGFRSMPLQGTSLHDEHVACLLKHTDRVAVWLDPDKAGRDAAAKVAKRLRVFGFDVHDVVSTKDPKLHTRAEINSIYEEIRWH